MLGTKLPKLCLLFLVFVSLFLVTLSYENEESGAAEQELHRCQLRCVKPLQSYRKQAACQERCVDDYKERKQEEQQQGGRTQDPRRELERCRRQCQEEEQGGRHRQICERGCQEEFEQQQQQRKQQEEQEKRGGSMVIGNDHHDPEKRFRQCQEKCQQRQQGEQRQYCKFRCQQVYEEQRRQQQGGKQGGSEMRESEKETMGSEEQQQQNNPYFFDSQRFKSRFRSQQGQFKVLEKFSKRSELLRGIENYRLAVLEANPRTFVVPHHADADAVFIVIKGRGTITLVRQDQKESFNLERGHVMRIPAGTTVYLVNTDNNEKLRFVKLIQPINTPGHFEAYFGAGGENPESFYRVFSDEILEAAFNTRRDRLQRIFGQQREGFIVRASEEQIRALSQHAGSSQRRGETESRGPFNLFSQRPSFSNQNGQFFEASPDNLDQLKELDVSVGFMNIKQGAMVAPHYNSRSTRLIFVAKGNGQFEMACPHISSQSQSQSQGESWQGSKGRRGEEGGKTGAVHYRKVTARFSAGDAFVVPAGHPFTFVASENDDLHLVGFGVNAHNNQKNFLAGRNNIWNQVESEAKALSFSVAAREVDEVFRRQEESYFLQGPSGRKQTEEEGRGHHLPSILDFVGFI